MACLALTFSILPLRALAASDNSVESTPTAVSKITEMLDAADSSNDVDQILETYTEVLLRASYLCFDNKGAEVSYNESSGLTWSGSAMSGSSETPSLGQRFARMFGSVSRSEDLSENGAISSLVASTTLSRYARATLPSFEKVYGDLSIYKRYLLGIDESDEEVMNNLTSAATALSTAYGYSPNTSKIDNPFEHYRETLAKASSSSSSSWNELRTYACLFSGLLQIRGLMYDMAIGNEATPMVSLYDNSSEFIRKGGTVKAENLVLTNAKFRTLLGVEGTTITQEQAATFDEFQVQADGDTDELKYVDAFNPNRTETTALAKVGDFIEVAKSGGSVDLDLAKRVLNIGKFHNAINLLDISVIRGQQWTATSIRTNDAKDIESISILPVKHLGGYKQGSSGGKWTVSEKYLDGIHVFYAWCQSPSTVEAGDTNTEEEQDEQLEDYDPEVARQKVKDDIATLHQFIEKSTQDPEWHLTENIVTGLALSALYRPFQTDLDSFEFSQIVQSDAFKMFQEKYGGLRKALLIADTGDAVSAYVKTGIATNLRVATLADILNDVDADKLIFVHDTYYNIDRIDYTLTDARVKQAYERLSEEGSDISNYTISDEGVVEGGDGAVTLPSVDKFNQHFKIWKEFQFSFDADAQQHAANVATNLPFRQHVHDMIIDDRQNSEGVSTYTGLETTLSIMSDVDLINIINNPKVTGAPIYMSSGRDIYEAPDSVYINYLQLANVIDNSPIRYTSALDMSSPIFVDIYGNILTESNVVIIPAAANATLAAQSKINWMTVMNLIFYGDSIYMTQTKDNAYSIGKHGLNIKASTLSDVADYAKIEGKTGDTSVFAYDELLNRYYLNPVEVPVNEISFQTANFDGGNLEPLQALYLLNRALYDKKFAKDGNIALDFNKWFGSILYPVTHGAKGSDIDYDKESLGTVAQHTNSAISQAAKLEEFHNNVASNFSNSLLAFPNLLYVDGIEYVIFFAFRIMCIITICSTMFMIYQQAAKGKFGIMVLFKAVLNVALVIVISFLFPMALDVTYYQANKALLQDEAITVAALNAEKENSGVDLGTIRAAKNDPKSQILIQVDNLRIPWYRYVRDIVASPDVLRMEDMFTRYETSAPNGFEQFELYGDKLYVNVTTLFNSSDVITYKANNKIQQIMKPNADASFYIPYYAILDYTLYNINQYNSIRKAWNYDLYFYGDGRMRSVGLCESYFSSDAFLVTRKDLSDPKFELPPNLNEQSLELAGYDKIGVNQFYGITAADSRSIFPNRDGFMKSQWYDDHLTQDQISRKIANLDDIAVNFVLKNRDLIGRISDESFIKLYALYMSLAYNREFHCGGPQDVEILQIANEDLLRLCIDDTATVMNSSPYNFAKFLLEAGGTPAVYAGAILDMVTIIASFVKPIATFFIFVAMVLSVFVYRCLLNKPSGSLRGMAIIIIILSLANILYAVFLNWSMFIPQIGFPPLICIFIQIVLQGAYLYFYVWLTSLVIRNWRDLGASTFSNIVHMRSVKLRDVSVNNWRQEREPDTSPRNRGIREYNRLHDIDESIHQNSDDEDNF